MNGSHLRHAPVTVAIVSRNHLVRIGLQAALAGQDRIRLSGEAAGRLEMDALIAREQPHALVIEMEPDLDIAELVRSVKQSAPETRIILLSPMGEMTSRMGSATSGIDGIVLTIQPAAVLLATINHVCCLPAATTVYECGADSRSGSAHLPPAGRPSSCLSTTVLDSALTGREQEIIHLIGQALTNKDIAERLCISSVTVRHHLTSIFGKLDVKSRQQLLVRAYTRGLLKLEERSLSTPSSQAM